MKDNTESGNGPIEAFPWPTQLTARVVHPGHPPRLYGYDVQRDLARHYSFSDLVALSLTGELPSARGSRALQVAMTFLLPCTIAEAPSHAAVLARICGAQPAGVLQAGALTLAEQAATWVRDHEPLRHWLARPDSPLPAEFASSDPSDDDAVQSLRDALGDVQSDVVGLDQRPKPLPALFCTLFACGLREPHQWVGVLLIARLPAVAAEAFAAAAGDFRGYPMDLPHFRYQEDNRG